MKNNICGIYAIVNTVNGNVYIGQSRTLELRWNRHKWSYNEYLKNKNKRGHKKLWFAFDKYGIDKFKFEILTHCGLKELDNKEKFFISLFNSFKEGYNCTEGADKPPFLIKHGVYQVCPKTLKVINYFESCMDAFRSTGVDNKSISKCRRTNKGLGGGFIWIKDLKNLNSYDILKKKIYQFDLKGQFIKKWDSKRKAAEFLGSNNTGGISGAIRGTYLTCFGYFWGNNLNDGHIKYKTYENHFKKLKLQGSKQKGLKNPNAWLKVYTFNNKGIFLKKFKNIETTASYYNSNYNRIRSYIKRGYCVKLQTFFQTKRKFNKKNLEKYLKNNRHLKRK